jgi:hypothetical protein
MNSRVLRNEVSTEGNVSEGHQLTERRVLEGNLLALDRECAEIKWVGRPDPGISDFVVPGPHVRKDKWSLLAYTRTSSIENIESRKMRYGKIAYLFTSERVDQDTGENDVDQKGQNIHVSTTLYLSSPRFIHRYEKTEAKDSDGHQISYEPVFIVNVNDKDTLVEPQRDIPTG